MGRVTGVVRNLIQGVSQQPAKERLPGQNTSQENMTSDIVTGLARRAGGELTRHVGTYTNGTFFYTYQRDSDEYYTVMVSSSGVSVVDQDGVAQPIVNNHAAAFSTYFGTGADLTAVTIGDTTLIANKSKVVGMSATTSPVLKYSGSYYHFIWFTGVEYGRTYRVVNGGAVMGSYTTPTVVTVSATTAQAAFTLDPSAAIVSLQASIGTNLTVQGTFAEDVLVVSSTIPLDLYSKGGSELKVVANQKVTDLKDLPPIAYDGMVFEVDNAKKLDADNFYLRYSIPGYVVPTSTGRWIECPGPSVLTELDPVTMPVAVRQVSVAAGFVVEYPNESSGGWDPREIGDDVTNKIPSFVGKRILGVGAFQTRLFFLAEDSFVTSQTGDYWNFWKNTALTSSADDRIDVIAPSANVSILESYAMYNRNLVLFSEGTQYIQSGDDPITPKTINLGVSTSYDMDLDCPPVSTGDTIMFCSKSGKFTQMQAFRLEDLTNLERATLLTGHIPEYIPVGVKQIVANSALGIACMRCADDLGLYINQWHIEGNQWVQQAWHHWDLKDHVPQHMFIRQNKLVLFCTRRGTTELDLVSLELTAQKEDNFGDILHLDASQYIPTDSWVASGADLKAPLPVPGTFTDLVCVQDVAGVSPRMPVSITTDGVYVYTSEFNNIDPAQRGVYVGSVYASSVEPTPPYIKDSEGEARLDSVLTVEEIVLNVRNSGTLKAELRYKYYDTIEMELNPPIIGLDLLGKWHVTSGPVSVPTFVSNLDMDISLKSVAHYPMTISDFSWRGQYTQSGRWV